MPFGSDADYYRKLLGPGRLLSEEAAHELRHIDDAIYEKLDQWCSPFQFHLWTHQGPEPARQIEHHVRYSITGKAVSDWFDGRKFVSTQLVIASGNNGDDAIVNDVSEWIVSAAENMKAIETSRAEIGVIAIRKQPLLSLKSGPIRIVWIDWAVTQRILLIPLMPST
jgi:hypothetical protein